MREGKSMAALWVGGGKGVMPETRQRAWLLVMSHRFPPSSPRCPIRYFDSPSAFSHRYLRFNDRTVFPWRKLIEPCDEDGIWITSCAASSKIQRKDQVLGANSKNQTKLNLAELSRAVPQVSQHQHIERKGRSRRHAQRPQQGQHDPKCSGQLMGPTQGHVGRIIARFLGRPIPPLSSTFSSFFINNKNFNLAHLTGSNFENLYLR